MLCSQVSGQVGFVENLGQWPAHVGFKTDLPGGALYLENNAFTYTFYDAELVNQMHHHAGPDVLPEFISRHAFQVEFEGATTDSVVGWREKQGLMNYFLGAKMGPRVVGRRPGESADFDQSL